METGEKDREMEMRRSLGDYSLVDPPGRRRRSSATYRQTLDHNHHGPPPNLQLQNSQTDRPSTREGDPDPDPDPDTGLVPVSSAPVAPLPRSYARRLPLVQVHHQQPGVRYKECQRNHAASSGGHVVDGCGEFMPAGEDGTPESLRCAACECHRSFHRKEVDDERVMGLNTISHYNVVTSGRSNPHRNQALSLPPLQHLHHRVPPIMMSFGGGGGPAESSTEDLNVFHQSLSMKGMDQLWHRKKRFRTKFNEEQKERMLEFAEKIGWRINKQEEEEVQRFCSQINVKRQVFKVWMHNNKQAARKKQM